MLEELHVRDLALIEEAWLEFGPGMTVLTGETGAGKTALLGALKLLMGERADSGAVRAGSAEALVEGRFSLDGAESLVRRRVSADGRSRCAIDGEMATVGALAERVGPLVDLHGQHEHQALLASTTHAGYLDRWIGETATVALARYREAKDAYRTASKQLAELDERIAQAARNIDYLHFVADEIDRIAPLPGEDDELQARLPALKHGEQLQSAADAAARSLRGEGGAGDRIAQARAALTKVQGIDPALDAISERLAEAEALTEDAGLAAREYRDNIAHDPAALDATLSRLSELSGLVKKYGPRLEDVIGTRDRARADLAAAQSGDLARVEAEKAVAAADATLRSTAAELTRIRTAAAPDFVSALQDAVAELAMGGARFEVASADLDFGSWTTDGPSRIEFLYAPAPGQPMRPLAKIASGGEISRVMLALKSVLGRADYVGTLVFDEVDAGIGGATATAVGKRLAELARDRQVIVVTHLAQVAAFADQHLVVARSDSANATATTVRQVVADERVAEVARMLSGERTEAAVEHARQLLGAAQAAVS